MKMMRDRGYEIHCSICLKRTLVCNFELTERTGINMVAVLKNLNTLSALTSRCRFQINFHICQPTRTHVHIDYGILQQIVFSIIIAHIDICFDGLRVYSQIPLYCVRACVKYLLIKV